MRAFHRRIFADIYEWVGELRSVAIAKDDSVFALPQHLETYLTRLLEGLASEARTCSEPFRARASSSESSVTTPS